MDVWSLWICRRIFISGALGTKEGRHRPARREKKSRRQKKAGKTVVFTRDTHQEKLFADAGRQEPSRAPLHRGIPPGWEIDPALDTTGARIFDKPSFGSEALVQYLKGWTILNRQNLSGSARISA